MNKYEQIYDLIKRKKNFQTLKILLTVSMYLVFSFSIAFFIFNLTLYAILMTFYITNKNTIYSIIFLVTIILSLLSLILTIMVFIDLIKKKKTRKGLFIGHSVSLIIFLSISISLFISSPRHIFIPVINIIMGFLLIFFTITYLSYSEKISNTIISLSKQISDADKEQN